MEEKYRNICGGQFWNYNGVIRFIITYQFLFYVSLGNAFYEEL